MHCIGSYVEMFLLEHVAFYVNMLITLLMTYKIVENQLFLLHLINSTEVERSMNISSSMMKVFQRGLLSQKYILHPILIFFTVFIFCIISYERLALAFRDDREPPKLTESGFQFLVRA